jgi:LysR family transcriptional regulator for metE and metH
LLGGQGKPTMNIAIEIRHLRTLKAIQETGSIVEAAERIHLTQSAISHQLKELEHRLEGPVLERKTKPLRFTPSGQRLLDLADDILPRIQSTLRDIQKMAGGQAGRLHIAIECHSCFQWLMPTLNSYRENWPEVELDLISGFNFDPLPALQQRELDLVITSDPLPIEGIRYVPLFRYESLLAVSKSHPWAKLEQIPAALFSNETLIAYPVDKQRLDVFREFLTPAGVEPKAIRTAELTIMMIQLVASGRGVCCLPNWAMTEYTEKDYVKTLSLGSGVWATLYAAVRADQIDTHYIVDFVNSARSHSFKHLKGIQHADNQPGS